MGSRFSQLRSMREFFLSAQNAFWVSAGMGTFCFVLGAAVTLHISDLVRDVLVSQHKQETFAILSEERARLEGQIGKTLALGQGLRSHIIVHPEQVMSQDNFAKISAHLTENNPVIRLIGLAPSNVISAVYPRKGNEKAIGLDYTSVPAQWPSVKEAMERRSTVIAGPVNLVQGGRALIARMPVYMPETPDQPLEERTYWGVISVVIDETNLMVAAGITDLSNQYRIAVVEHGDATASDKVVFGDAGAMSDDAISLQLHLPGIIDWEIRSLPIDGWRNSGKEVWISLLAGLALSALFAVMAFLLVLEVIRVRTMALHDALTGLANRRLLNDRMSQLATMSERTGAGFDIFYVDLNAFKPVNDNFGHVVGDLLLIEVAKRLKDHTRRMDTVARVGGDEFVVLAPGGMSREERAGFSNRLSARVGQSFKHGEASIAVRASIGNASFPEDANTVDDLLRIADARMYEQKGRSDTMTVALADAALSRHG